MKNARGAGRAEAKFKGVAKTRSAGPLNLAPKWLVFVVFMISFSLPNLVFSGVHWFDTLHIMKWTVAMVPIALLTIVTGIQIMRRGAKGVDFSLDLFGAAWLILVLLVTSQLFFVKISSISTYVKEWFYFGCLFAVYFLSFNLFRGGRLHRAVLWGSSVNAAINVFFAELLIRGLNDGIPFILNVPGNYIGNTAQQEMFGLWMAMSVLNSLFLHMFYVGEAQREAGFFKWARTVARAVFSGGGMQGISLRRWSFAIVNFVFLLINAWGLWSSTARGAIASLLIASIVLVVGLLRSGEASTLRVIVKLFAVVIIVLVVFLGVSMSIGTGRGNALVSKFMDMIMNPTSIGGRISIWRTSLEVYLKEPLTGVGLGQYKWHFLDGQRIMYANNPELYDSKGYEWQYTYWAHSEYIQWACETGLIGSIILLALALLWLYNFFRVLKAGERISMAALWGCSMIFLLWFDALFSRPFHRIENSVWMSLAFALSNREILPERFRKPIIDSDMIYRCFGALITGISIYGLIFLYGGLKGDKLIYRALISPGSVQVKLDQLNKAERYLMSKDDAREQIGALLVEVGKRQDDTEILEEGFNHLYKAFLRRPTSRLLFDIFRDARDTGFTGLAQEVAFYMREIRPPGSADEAVSQGETSR
ncbi:MAG: O-antigen ligase family protein [Synergistaceae bacterium]|jgi:hypothetical protein|nr:O-antigen ligase family protein [Synergistaceae bacterium]